MTKCLIIQKIHEKGLALLAQAGMDVELAASPLMSGIVRQIGEAEAVITRDAGLARMAMQAAPKLRVVGVHGVGVDKIDIDYATEQGIVVVNTPHSNTRSVAELAIAHMMALAKRVREADRAVRAGDFDYRYRQDVREIGGASLLVLGFGSVGRLTAQLAQNALGMDVHVYSRSVSAEEIGWSGYIAEGDLEAALPKADYVSLHLVLNEATRGIINRERLALMRPGSVLINTARGGLVDSLALIEAVETGHLRGAALDVFDPEPLPADHPLVRTDGILLSPHIGGASLEARERTATDVARAVIGALRDERPRTLVNPGVWDLRRRAPSPLGHHR